MSEIWSQSEGEVVDNRFRLRQYLGGTDDSAVFLTQIDGANSKNAAIKFVPAGPSADLQLSLWHRIKQLTHPNLLRIFEIGRCRIQNRDRLYVVMEYAEENLAQILPERALSEAEAREMLGPVLDALVFLHGNGLAHSHIKPSNILATADKLKLSSDTIFPIGEARKSSRKLDLHDAPEIGASPVSTPADVWSLGMTLVETLTQRPITWQTGSQADPVVPETIPQPLLDIARHALRREPRRRWSVGEIAARLNPAVAAAAAAGQSISPLAVPLSPVAPVPAARLSVPKLDVPPPRPQPKPAPKQTQSTTKQTLTLPNYVVPVGAVLLTIVAIIALPKILGRRADSSSAASSASAPVTAPPKRADQPAATNVAAAPAKPSATSTAQDSLKNAAEKKPATLPSPTSAGSTPATGNTDSTTSAISTSAPSPHSGSSSPRGEVLDQVLPDVSEKALATIK